MKKQLALLIILLSALSGCTGGSKSASEISPDKESSPILKYSILTGSGGGFTGMYQGYQIDSTGSVLFWEGINFEKGKKQDAGKLTPRQIEELNDLFISTKVTDSQSGGRGNITSYIIFRSADKEDHTLSWEGLEPGGSVPPDIRKFNNILNQILETLSVKK